MVLNLSLMASHGYPPGLVLQQDLGLGSIAKGSQPFLPSSLAKPEIIRYRYPNVRLNPCDESWKSRREWFASNQFVNVDSAGQRPMLTDVQETYPNAVLFSFGIVDRFMKHDKILQYLMYGATEADIGGVHKSLPHDLMGLQLLGIDVPHQQLSPFLIYPKSMSYIEKPLLDFIGDLALNSKVIVHPDGLVTFMGTVTEMKDLISELAESYLSKISQKEEKHSLLVPQFSRLKINEAEARNHSSTLKIQTTLTVPLRSPEKVKVKPLPKKSKKVSRERDLYKKNYLHACEILLSLIVVKRQRQKTAILSLKKSGPELPDLLTQFSATIAGTGLAVLLSVICKVACGRAPFCASKLFNTGFGFGLIWLSGAVNKLRDIIVGISKNAGRLGLKDEEMIQKLDKNIREIYFRTAALLAVAVLRLA